MRRSLRRLGDPTSKGRFRVLPDSLRPLELSPAFTSFPLPRYDEQTGFNPQKIADVPEVQQARIMMSAQRRSAADVMQEEPLPPKWGEERLWEKGQGAASGANTSWYAEGADAEALVTPAPLADGVNRRGEVGQQKAIGGVHNAVHSRHLQYEEEGEHALVQRLVCLRPLSDVLDQLRSSTRPQDTHVHVAALGDIVATVGYMPESELVEMLRCIRDVLPAGPGALYFPAFTSTIRRHLPSVNTDVAKLHAYLNLFIALEDRAATFDAATGLPMHLAMPQAFTEILATAAHVQLFNRKAAFKPDEATGRDNLGPTHTPRVRLEKWPGYRLLEILEDIIETSGDRGFDSFEVLQVAQLFAALVGLCLETTLPSRPLQALLNRFTDVAETWTNPDAQQSEMTTRVLLAASCARIASPRLIALVEKVTPSPALFRALSRSRPRLELPALERLAVRALEGDVAPQAKVQLIGSIGDALRGYAGIAPERTLEAVAVARRLRLSDQALELLGQLYPWDAPAEEDEYDGGVAVAPPPANSDADVVEFTGTNALVCGSHIVRFGSVMMSAPRDRYLSTVIVHSGSMDRGMSAMEEVAEKAIKGKSLVLLAFSTLLATHEAACSATVEARAILQHMLFELQHGRAAFVSLVDELQLQSTAGSATETSVLIDCAARALEKLVTAPPAFVVSANENPFEAFMQRDNVHAQYRSDANATTATTHSHGATRQHLLAYMSDMSTVSGGDWQVSSTRMDDRTSARFDYRASTKQRHELWSMQRSTSMYDKKYRSPGGKAVLRGFARNASGADMRYIGIHTPGNNQ